MFGVSDGIGVKDNPLNILFQSLWTIQINNNIDELLELCNLQTTQKIINNIEIRWHIMHYFFAATMILILMHQC